MRTLAFAISLALLPGAHAQIGNPAFMAPDTAFDRPGVPAPNQPNAVDRLFAKLLIEGGLAEIALGQLAADEAAASSVQDFANRMVADHTNANQALAGIAADSGIAVPDALTPHHMEVQDRLEDRDSADFDLDYMRTQVVEHQKAVSLLIWEIGSGQDAQLQQQAAATLPAVLAHLDRARQIVAELSARSE